MAISHNVCDDIYPGVYVPLLNEREVDDYMHQPHKNQLTFPIIDINELSSFYKIEVVIPGLKREDFFVCADDNILSVCVVPKEKRMEVDSGIFNLHGSNYECVDRNIILPKDADPEFISAEYKDGTLCMYAPKTKRPVRNLHNNIVVY